MYNFTQEELIKFHNRISDNVKRVRKEKGYTQLDLSLELGMKNSSFISHAENHKVETHHYSLEHLYKMSVIFKIDLSEFY